jgi:P27 family predicted phage terminase small subunit
MGKRGPKPTPTAILAARGSYLARANPCEPLPPRGVPTVPMEVASDPEALATWARLVPILGGAGVLTILDGEALGNYCLLCAMRARAYAALRGLRESNPAKPVEQSTVGRKITRQIIELSTAMRAAETEFGMTPSSRARIVLPGEAGAKRIDPLREYMND